MKTPFRFVILFVLLGGGCVSYTSLSLQDPPGSKLWVKNQEYVFPSEVRLAQNTSLAITSKGGYDIEMQIPHEGRLLSARGILYVYKVAFTDVDELAKNHFSIPKDKLDAMRRGAAITIEGFTADGKKPVYRAVLGLKSVGE